MCASADAHGRSPSAAGSPYDIPAAPSVTASSSDTHQAGYSRKNRPAQNRRTLPRRSSENGTTYPLTRKNTNTPYRPKSNHGLAAPRTSGSSTSRECSNTTTMAARPRRASSQSMRDAFSVREPICVCGGVRVFDGIRATIGAARSRSLTGG